MIGLINVCENVQCGEKGEEQAFNFNDVLKIEPLYCRTITFSGVVTVDCMVFTTPENSNHCKISIRYLEEMTRSFPQDNVLKFCDSLYSRGGDR